MGEPIPFYSGILVSNTGGTETSKYLEEEKSIEILGVVASETKTA